MADRAADPGPFPNILNNDIEALIGACKDYGLDAANFFLVMTGPLVPADKLEMLRDQAWGELNSSECKTYKKAAVAEASTLSIEPERTHEGS